LQDKLGTVRDVLDRSGTLIARVEYNAFGVIQSVTNAAGQTIALPTRWLYTCQEYDPITGNIWFSNGQGRGRWYSPTLNRFLQPDELGFAAGDMNLGRYVGNSPTNASDPSGRDTVRIEGENVVWVIERPDNRSLGQKVWDGMVGNVVEPVRKVVIGRIEANSCGESLTDEIRGELDPGGVNRGGHLRTVRVSDKWGGKEVLLPELQQAARLSENGLAEMSDEDQDAAIQQYLTNVREGKYHSKYPARDLAAGFAGRPDLADNPDSSAYHRGEVLREAGERAKQVADLMRGMPGRGVGLGPCPGAKKGSAPKKGIYEFPDQKADDKPYVGQSRNMPKRLDRHEAEGRLKRGTETTKPVEGGTTDREIAEHKRIQELTGGQRAKSSDAVSNKRDPIGPNRRPELGLPEPTE